MMAKELEQEKQKLLELLEAQHNPEQVEKRRKQLMEFLNGNMNTEKSGVVALALAKVLDDALFGVIKTASQQNPTQRGRIICPS
jgi:hypothetical protein